MLSTLCGDLGARILKVNLVVFCTLKVTRTLELHLNAYNQVLKRMQKECPMLWKALLVRKRAALFLLFLRFVLIAKLRSLNSFSVRFF
jgi:hypothetical protein